MNEVDEDTKKRIAEKYKEIINKQSIIDASNELGVSEATFHKYKNFEYEPEKKIIKKVEEEDEEESKNFQKEVTPDDEDDDDDILIEQVNIF